MNIKLFRNMVAGVTVITVLGVGLMACERTSDPMRTDQRSDSMATEITDTALTARVRTRLSVDQEPGVSGISVTTDNGVVTLDGEVDSAETGMRLEEAVRTVDGVRGVNNNLVATSRETGMESAGRAVSDSWITTKVKSVLLADDFGKGLDVDVETSRGVVVLKGRLEDQTSVDHVVEIVEGVEGVQGVDTSELMVSRN